MKFWILIFFFPMLTLKEVVAQDISAKLGIQTYKLHDAEYGDIQYHVSLQEIHRYKKVLLYLDGSGAMPLYQMMQNGLGSSVPFQLSSVAKDYHVVFISKPGVPLIDSVYRNAEGRFVYHTPIEYDQKLSLDWRVNTANLVLNKVLQTLNVDSTGIAVLGISEGFQVAAKLISKNKRITHAMLMVGNGLNQMYDFIILNRMKAAAGLISMDQAQLNIDSLYNQYRQIYQQPFATDKQWYGHTYLRWASFASINPSENILQSTIPILIVAASEDQNTTVLSTDFIYLESLRLGKANIEYKVYPYNHSMQFLHKDAKGNVLKIENKMPEVINDIFTWFNTKQLDRNEKNNRF